MRNESPFNNAQTIWQTQKTEEITMSITQLKQKAEQHRTKTRLMVVVNDLTFIAAIVFFVFIFTKTTDATSRIGLGLLIVGAAFVMYRAHKQIWPLVPPSEVPPASGLETYRQELLRSRDASRNFWRTLLPVIPGLLVYTLPRAVPLVRTWGQHPAFLVNALPVFVLFGIWLALVFPGRKRKLRKLQQEIEMLDSFAGTHSDLPG